jgi:diacylglycerol kinase
MDKNKFSLRKRIRSFGYAFNGLWILIKEEHNARIHLLATIIAIAAGFYFRISGLEWIGIAFAIALVFVAEIINSALENTADLITKDKNPSIKKIKDLSAAAVLFSAITALIIAAIVFIPKISELCSAY